MAAASLVILGGIAIRQRRSQVGGDIRPSIRTVPPSGVRRPSMISTVVVDDVGVSA